MWKGLSMLGETLDEGDPPGASRKVSNDDTFRDFDFVNPQLIFVSTGLFVSR